jgi:hypothetical protein
MTVDIRDKLTIEESRLKEVNNFIMDPKNKIINDFLAIIEKYGGPEEINRKARENGKVENLMNRLREKKSPFLKDLEWLIEKRDQSAFITVDEYRKKILGDQAIKMTFEEDFAVTLEISACQYFH